MSSPERIYLSNIDNVSDESHLKHIYRYLFASMFIDGGIVLDCACGSGYGSKILSQKADRVYGIDISKEAIDYGYKNNYNENIFFNCQSLQNIYLEDNTLKAVVSLETIEHIKKEDMINFLKKSSNLLMKDGCFIGSSPMLRYVDDKPYITNPHHINELPRNELIEIIEECFVNFKINYFHQKIKSFVPLNNENTGFCVFVARKT